MHAFDVLGDPVRRRILELLAGGERASGDITAMVRAEFGISQPAVSQHLKVLRDSGFASVRPAGARRLYAMELAPLQAVDAWLDQFRAVWEPRLDALALAEETGAGVTRLRAHLLVAQSSWQLGMPEVTDHHLALAHEVATGLACPHWQAMAWLAQSRLDPDGVSLRLKAATHVHFYLQQLAPRARQEFLHWPERRDAVQGRGTGALELRIEAAPRLSSPL